MFIIPRNFRCDARYRQGVQDDSAILYPRRYYKNLMTIETFDALQLNFCVHVYILKAEILRSVFFDTAQR